MATLGSDSNQERHQKEPEMVNNLTVLFGKHLKETGVGCTMASGDILMKDDLHKSTLEPVRTCG